MSSSRKSLSLQNKIVLTGKIWVASDIHLGPDAPATARAFKTFLSLASQEANALILLGDIFDAWIGDDVALESPPVWLAEILTQLQQVSASIPLYLGRGNRDFLIGHALAQHVNAQLLADKCVLQTDSHVVLLSHGDEYCTADKNYQRFRRIVRCPAVQGLFLSLSLARRRRIANWARNRSKQSNQHKPAQIMDVDPNAIEKAWSSSGLNTMVHGHTHRPAVHTSEHLGRTCTRFVLPDWEYDHGKDARSGWLQIDADAITLHQDVFPSA